MKKFQLMLFSCFVLTIASESTSAEKFTLVILPDTQYYLDQCKEHNIYLHQTQWIADSADVYNIKFVAHKGDVTNGSTQSMCEAAREAHQILFDAGIPFNIVLGNHDYDGPIYQRETPDYTAAFGSFNPPWYDGHMGDGIENTFTTFSAEGFDFLIVSLEYTPTKYVITNAALCALVFMSFV